MQIRTSNINKIGMLQEMGYVFVLIDDTPPPLPGMFRANELIPQVFLTNGVKNGNIGSELFSVLYLKQLERVSCSALITQIMNKCGNKTKICFVSSEQFGTFSHRKILSEWLEKEGFHCHEIYMRSDRSG
jgi:hypothetical protein